MRLECVTIMIPGMYVNNPVGSFDRHAHANQYTRVLFACLCNLRGIYWCIGMHIKYMYASLLSPLMINVCMYITVNIGKRYKNGVFKPFYSKIFTALVMISQPKMVGP